MSVSEKRSENGETTADGPEKPDRWALEWDLHDWEVKEEKTGVEPEGGVEETDAELAQLIEAHLRELADQPHFDESDSAIPPPFSLHTVSSLSEGSRWPALGSIAEVEPGLINRSGRPVYLTILKYGRLNRTCIVAPFSPVPERAFEEEILMESVEDPSFRVLAMWNRIEIPTRALALVGVVGQLDEADLSRARQVLDTTTAASPEELLRARVPWDARFEYLAVETGILRSLAHWTPTGRPAAAGQGMLHTVSNAAAEAEADDELEGTRFEVIGLKLIVKLRVAQGGITFQVCDRDGIASTMLDGGSIACLSATSAIIENGQTSTLALEDTSSFLVRTADGDPMELKKVS